MTSQFTHYVERQMGEVQGWTGSNASVLMLEQISQMQDASCAEGGVLEIGVHHARFLIALHELCAPGTRSLGLDLFEDQSKNVDRSGSGEMTVARGYIDRFAREPELIELRSGDSLALRADEWAAMRDEYGPFRFVSVDGGHTAEHIVSDLMNAAGVAHAGGLIFVDDFFHPAFPGVTEGFYELARTHAIPWVPLFLNRKKLVLCHASMRPSYWVALTRTHREQLDAICRPKVVRIAGHDVVCYQI